MPISNKMTASGGPAAGRRTFGTATSATASTTAAKARTAATAATSTTSKSAAQQKTSLLKAAQDKKKELPRKL